MKIGFVGTFPQLFVGTNENVIPVLQNFFGKRYDHMFSENTTTRPIFGRMAEISMVELPKPTNQNPKITKIRIFLKFDLEVVAHSE